MQKSLALLLVLASLTGCASLPKQGTPVFVPPASCIEPAQELPVAGPDLLDYIADITVQYVDLAVLRNQCRTALTKSQHGAEHTTKGTTP